MDLNLISDEQFQKRLLDIFKKEAIGHVNSLIDGIIEIERRGISADNTAIIDRLFRNAHSLKGSSRTVNILSIEGICQVLEEIFYDIKKGKLTITEPLLNSLNKAIKIIERIIDNPTQKIDYENAIKQLKDMQIGGNEAVTDEDMSPFITDVSESIEKEFTDDTYDFVKVQTGALDSLLSKIEETVAFKGFVNDNKQRIASVMQK
ncbi:MAG: Hpt domain-containing protein, partial [Thermodesulfovibrionales bacterium]|nr:Hpt domain-containing protein [Thermodesulfovibrionales bacterium]